MSHETAQQTERRLRAVLAAAELRVLPGVWAFREDALDRFELDPVAIAVVRDEELWSQLVPAARANGATESFGVFSFHFPDEQDNSGFVGWLAGELKRRLGTGVFVVCGSNRSRGGIFDYWGTPSELLADALAVIEELKASADRTEGLEFERSFVHRVLP